MRPIVQTLTGPSAALQIPLDTYLNPFLVDVDVIVSGTVSYTVQGSNDNPWSGSAPTNLIAAGTFPTGAQTAAAQGALTVPTRQLYVQVSSGTGSITVRVTQSGQVG